MPDAIFHEERGLDLEPADGFSIFVHGVEDYLVLADSPEAALHCLRFHVLWVLERPLLIDRLAKMKLLETMAGDAHVVARVLRVDILKLLRFHHHLHIVVYLAGQASTVHLPLVLTAVVQEGSAAQANPLLVVLGPLVHSVPRDYTVSVWLVALAYHSAKFVSKKRNKFVYLELRYARGDMKRTLLTFVQGPGQRYGCTALLAATAVLPTRLFWPYRR